MIVVIKDQYNGQLRLFRKVNRVEKSLISQILSAINAEFLNALINLATNAIPEPVHLILDYLKDTYGKFTPQLLYKKETLLRAINYAPASPIDTIFTAVEDLTDYSKLNDATMTQQQTIVKAYIILNKGDQLKEEIKTWNRLYTAHKTWIAFKIHFHRSHNEYRETTNTTLEEAANEQRNAHLVQRTIKGVQAITEEPYIAYTEIGN